MFRKAATAYAHHAFGFAAASTLLAAQILLATDASASGPAVIHVPGIVRDFRASHPDFDAVPAAGYGHYAGNLDLTLGADRRPVFLGAGYRVAVEWRNKYGVPIAPHLYSGVTPIQVASSPLTASDVTLDSYDPDAGLYGVDGNVGAAPDIMVGATMPKIVPPTDLGPSVGAYDLNPGSAVISSSFRCDSFTAKNGAIIQIDGDVTIVCDGNFTMQTGAVIELLPDARLRLYVMGAFATYQGAMINMNTQDPRRVLIYVLGTAKVDISQYSEIAATFVAPNTSMELGQDVQFYGSFYGGTIDMRQGSGFHSVGVEAKTTCGDTVEDMLGVCGSFTSGGITSSATFDQWYNDVLGTNLSQVHTFDLVLDSDDVYKASFSEFYPIDDRLYGNEGMAHNCFFTYTFNATFTYESCTGQYIAFGGADDAWLFVDDQLALDVGGVQPATFQMVELDRLNLTDGQTYTVSFFFAQRNPLASSFDFRTNVVLTPPTLVAAGSASFD